MRQKWFVSVNVVFYMFASNESSHAQLIEFIYMIKVSLAHSWNRAKWNKKKQSTRIVKKNHGVGASLLLGCCRRCRLILFISMFHVRIISFSTQFHREIFVFDSKNENDGKVRSTLRHRWSPIFNCIKYEYVERLKWITCGPRRKTTNKCVVGMFLSLSFSSLHLPVYRCSCSISFMK